MRSPGAAVGRSEDRAPWPRRVNAISPAKTHRCAWRWKSHTDAQRHRDVAAPYRSFLAEPGNSLLFRVPAKVSLFRQRKFPVPVAQGICVQHARIAAQIGLRGAPDGPKNRRFPVIFPHSGNSPITNPDCGLRDCVPRGRRQQHWRTRRGAPPRGSDGGAAQPGIGARVHRDVSTRHSCATTILRTGRCCATPSSAWAAPTT